MELAFGGCALYVRDLAKSRRFYEELLGQRVVLDNGPHLSFEGGFAIWQVDDALCKVLETQPEPGQGPLGARNCQLYFECPNVAGLEKRLIAAGVSPLRPAAEREWGQVVLCLADPDGHLVEVGEPAQVVVARLRGRGLSAQAIAEQSRLPLAMVRAFWAAMGE